MYGQGTPGIGRHTRGPIKSTMTKTREQNLPQKAYDNIHFLSDDDEDTQIVEPASDTRPKWTQNDKDYLTKNPDVLLDILRDWDLSATLQAEDEDKEESQNYQTEITTQNDSGLPPLTR